LDRTIMDCYDISGNYHILCVTAPQYIWLTFNRTTNLFDIETMAAPFVTYKGLIRNPFDS
jgi:hypothetical protein